MGLYDNVKDVASIIQKSDNVELYKKILDIQKESMDLSEENRKLKEKIRELEELIETKEALIYKDECYYMKSENEELDGPYCSRCWDKDKKLIRMHIDNSRLGKVDNKCPECKVAVLKETYPINNFTIY